MQSRTPHRILLAVLLATLMCLSSAALVAARPAYVSVEHLTYVPIIQQTYPDIQLYGYVTENGTPAAGVTVHLLYDASGDCSQASYPTNDFRTVTTDSTGRYNFTDIPNLARGTLVQPCYATAYVNSGHTPQRLASWWNAALVSYTRGSTINAGNFDIADAVRTAPADGAQFSKPIDTQQITLRFTWTPRPAAPTDTYYLRLYEPGLEESDAYSSGPLGYVGSFTKTFSLCLASCSASQGALRFNGTYRWRLTIIHNAGPLFIGQGETFERTFTIAVRR